MRSAEKKTSAKRQGKVDRESALDCFRQHPTWEQYFDLLKQVKREPSFSRRRRLFNELNRLAQPLCRGKPHSPLLQVIYLELGNRSFDDAWRERSFREFCVSAMKYAWGLPSSPGYELAKTLILKHRVSASDALRDAFHSLRKGEAPINLPPKEAEVLLLWVQTKYGKRREVDEIIRDLHQALAEGSTEKATMFWKKLIQLLPAQRLSIVEVLQPLVEQLQQSIDEFTVLVQEQSVQIAQRDAFISLLRQQQDYSEEVIQQAREQAEVRVKRDLMQRLAEPLDLLRSVAASGSSGDDLALISQSFEQTLADLNIFPVGEIGKRFQVGPDDLVRPEDGESVAGCEVEQTGLGWELRLSGEKVWPLVRPRVRRVVP